MTISVLVRRVTVNTAIAVTLEPAVVLQDIEHPRHLRENQDSRALRLDLGQKLVENGQLAAILDQVLIRCVWGSGLHTVEEIGVVGTLAQLHEDVLQAHFLDLSSPIHDVDVLHQDLSVEVTLHLGQADVQVDLLLGLEVKTNITILHNAFTSTY